jgi:hypothetical protein
MAIGLNKQELWTLLSFGDTPEEIKSNLFPSIQKKTAATEEILTSITAFLIEKIVKVTDENNKRITEQFIAAGIKI